MSNLTLDKKIKIYRKLLIVANHYYYTLSNRKKFLIIDENNDTFQLSCRLKDFAHLTGIRFNFNDNRFFGLFLSGQLRIDNINDTQKYSYRTIIEKLDNLDEACSIFQSSLNERLLLSQIITNTRNYPYGICGNNCVICLDGNSTYHPHSIRNESQTKIFLNVTDIKYIYIKDTDEKEYSKLIYKSCEEITIPTDIKNKYNIII